MLAAIALNVGAGIAPQPLRPSARPADAAGAVANCRFGITTPSGVAGYDLNSLGVAGYLDWALRESAQTFPGVEYVQTVRLRDSQGRYVFDPQYPEIAAALLASIQAVAAARPGSTWLIGNEPDTTYENQDSLTPEQYAEAYHELYPVVKAADPNGRVGIGTIVQPTPLRLQWLDYMWAEYLSRYGTTPPSDFWSIHSFILREERGSWGTGIPPGSQFQNVNTGMLYDVEETDRLDFFQQRLRDFRAWMAAKGEQNKPLWITEYGSLMPHDGSHGYYTFPIERTRDYMLATFDFLRSAADANTGYALDGNRLVQRWYWYSLNDYQWKMGGGLFDPERGGARTIIGDAFVAYVNALPMQINAGAYEFSLTYAFPATGAGPVTYTLTGRLVNSGNSTMAPGARTAVSTRANSGAEYAEVAAVESAQEVRGCGEFLPVGVIWDEPAVPLNPARVAVAAPAGVTDSDPSDNTRDVPIYPFTDIDGSFGREAIVEVAWRNIIVPVSATYFDTQGLITRATMATFMSNAYTAVMGEPAPIVPTPFTDIGHLPQDVQDDIARIYGLGITVGTTATTYSPDLSISRNQMAVFLSRLYKSITGDFAPIVETPFTDIDTPGEEWARDHIARIYGLGITIGTTATTFSPYLLVTREQMALFIVRLLRSAGK